MEFNNCDSLKYKAMCNIKSNKNCERCKGKGFIEDKHSTYACSCVIGKYISKELREQLRRDTLRLFQDHKKEGNKYSLGRNALGSMMVAGGIFKNELEIRNYDSYSTLVFFELVEEGLIIDKGNEEYEIAE